MGVAGDSKLDKKVAKAARDNERSNGVADWRGYINVNLDASEKAQFDDWMKTDDPWDTLAETVESGCHIGLKLNHEGGGFMASITQRNPLHVNAGLSVTARSSEAGKAMFRALYLVSRLGVNRDWAAGQAPADKDRW